jgi:starch-binding outer membrane protein, SusD/RagB family
MKNRDINSSDFEGVTVNKPGYGSAPAPGGSARSAARAFVIITLIGSAAACDSLDRALRVEAPGIVDAEVMNNPENAHLLVSGTQSDLECALGAYVVNAGLLGNELRDASITSARFSLDARTITETAPYGTNSCAGNPPGVYEPLSTAIWTSNNALTRLEGWTDAEVANRTRMIAQAAAYSGYAHTLMAEGFCSSVITELGPEVQPSEIFAVAETRFTRAIEAAAAERAAPGASAGRIAFADSIRNMALIGRARVRLQRNNPTGAAADARAALTAAPNFVRNATASQAEARRWNRIAEEFRAGNASVAPAYRGLTVGGVPDVRTASVNIGAGHNQPDTVWMATKIGTARNTDLRTRPVPIATWREAHLIIAEAEGGQEAVDRINVLRAHHGLPLFQSADAVAIREQVIQERQRELFLEGHHLSDLRRFNLPQIPASGANYRQGGLYGDARCFPIPAVERATNPNLS